MSSGERQPGWVRRGCVGVVRLVAIAVAAALGVGMVEAAPVSAADAPAVDAPPIVQVSAPGAVAAVHVWQTETSNGTRALRLRWTKVSDAEFYLVLRRDPAVGPRYVYLGQGTASKPDQSRATQVRARTFTDRTATLGRTYSYKVVACRSDLTVAPAVGSAAAACASPSRWVSARLIRHGMKVANAHKISYVPHAHAFGLGESYRLRAKALPTVTTSAHGTKVLDKYLRYRSTNPAIATVNAHGVVTARRVGSAAILAIAHNGLERRIPLRVRNYAYPTAFHDTGVTAELWKDQGPRMRALVTMYLTQHLADRFDANGVTWSLDNNGKLLTRGKVRSLPPAFTALIEQIIDGFWATTSIGVGRYGIDFNVSDPQNTWLVHLTYLTDDYGPSAWPAPHWYYWETPLVVYRPPVGW